MEMPDFKSTRKCDCERAWCEFFNGGEGDGGTSYSRQSLEYARNELIELKNDIPSQIEHLDKLLSEK